MKNKKRIAAVVALLGIGLLVVLTAMRGGKQTPKGDTTTEAAPSVLTVSTVVPEMQQWPVSVKANGTVAAWQETIIGSELSGVRLVEVLANVGDIVAKGDVIARLQSDSIAAEYAQQEAVVDAQNAAAAEARANAVRARTLSESKLMSAQQANQYITAERSANANLQEAMARLESQRIRLRQTVLRAPDAGAISERAATVGSVVSQGDPLFKLIRQARLEWRAEVPADMMSRIKPGQTAHVQLTDGTTLDGTVRARAPTVDQSTFTALIYVDLPRSDMIRAGMFVSGGFELGNSQALTVPQSAVVFRDGASYVYCLGRNNKVVQTTVTIGRRAGQRIEVTRGLHAGTRLVEQGAGFLADGDVVRVLQAKQSTSQTDHALSKSGGEKT
ncbi:efflux RND transporter periplasmic adaptor subunit [Xanthomonas sacchari]|uniref:Multidrug resistance protein MexA n=1 Tax=Xanthomonas sacchari TaxID=56458 RepID=A0ABT3DUM3_9XANT|nr:MULTISPECIES: efflux RND transporter periplasmic adaptor subunit [Xanthomonas]MCW0372977.1 Multidrug resistance protein MexA [Xanthomonas sacchari]MCW0380820.1 Multidrug resistance protein MexA [Xanthomonas sacchari]MCW0399197.1 Multidrug resistance protein MexA [Xanthomonas sacchari]MCW0411594.1 Multidrug resistance protein MexA [Xanthomonas sacchari]MCW0420433.1 Multidrug resistance protein MexA [Xanthomonas sacchari]